MTGRDADELMQQLGRRIRDLRRAQERTQEEIAEMAGLSSTYLVRIERGRHSVTLETLRRIADALGIKLWKLVVPEDHALAAELPKPPARRVARPKARKPPKKKPARRTRSRRSVRLRVDL